jgi:hypothetical protein
MRPFQIPVDSEIHAILRFPACRPAAPSASTLFEIGLRAVRDRTAERLPQRATIGAGWPGCCSLAFMPRLNEE